jgi:hypothetical protein
MGIYSILSMGVLRDSIFLGEEDPQEDPKRRSYVDPHAINL